jgi:hypothetical protein
MLTVSYLFCHMYIFNCVSSLYLDGLRPKELHAIHEITFLRRTYFFRSMDKWRDKDGFLLQSEFRQWVEGVVNKALNRLDKKERNCYELKIKDPVPSGRMSKYYVCYPLKNITCVVCCSKCGPVLFSFILYTGMCSFGIHLSDFFCI